MEDSDLSQAIQQTAAGPASVTIDGNTATAQDVLKQIAADRYLASKAAVKLRHRGLRFNKCSGTGA